MPRIKLIKRRVKLKKKLIAPESSSHPLLAEDATEVAAYSARGGPSSYLTQTGRIGLVRNSRTKLLRKPINIVSEKPAPSNNFEGISERNKQGYKTINGKVIQGQINPKIGYHVHSKIFEGWYIGPILRGRFQILEMGAIRGRFYILDYKYSYRWRMSGGDILRSDVICGEDRNRLEFNSPKEARRYIRDAFGPE